MDGDLFSRIISFMSWQGFVSPVQLANAGFRYTGREDQVECPDCQIVVDNWQTNDSPRVVHRQRSPDCPSVANFERHPNPISMSSLSLRANNEQSISVYGNETLSQSERQAQSHVMEQANSRPTETPTVQLSCQISDRNNPDYMLLKSEQVRFSTFYDWPRTNKANPRELAREGFFYFGNRDRVRCAFCRGVLHNWMEDDRPQVEHRKHFSECFFVQGRDVGNVPMSGVTNISQRSMDSLQARNQTSARQSPPVIACLQNSTNQLRAGNEGTVDTVMNSIPVKAALNSGFAEVAIRTAVQKKLSMNGGVFDSVESLIESIFESESELKSPARAADAILSSSRSEAEGTGGASSAGAGSPAAAVVGAVSAAGSSSSATLSAAEVYSSLSEQSSTGESSTTGHQEPTSQATGAKKRRKKVAKRKEKIANGSATNRELTNMEVQANPSDTNTGIMDIEEEELMQENANLREARTCKVCMDREVDTVFLPCGHLVCCAQCAVNIRNCAVCRTLIRGTVKVFLS